MDKATRAEQIAIQIIKYSRNELLVSLRFMDLALCKLIYRAEDVKRLETDGKYLYFNPRHIFNLYETGNNELNHSHLHSVFHCIFYHPFVNKAIEQPLWDLACDIAVEGVISELNMKQLDCVSSLQINQELSALRAKYGKLTAERLYRKFLNNNIKNSEVIRLKKLFGFDDHSVWYVQEKDNLGNKKQQNSPSQQNSSSTKESDADDDMDSETKSNIGETNSASQSSDEDNSSADMQDADANSEASIISEWKEISERVKIDLETSSKEWGDRSANLMQNITEVNRETYDYSDFLRKFTVMGEEIQINDDEFDYIFYTYGLQLYKNVPLVEPLEYKEVKKVKEFVIAIDTSGSVQGDLVKRFVTKTYNVLEQQSNFFTKVNVHIIQCDAQIQKDDKITSKADFDQLMKHLELRGFGGTDFRPVFSYVDELISRGEFENLKGLIYFTDGYGTFPEKKPAYDTAFVFVDDEFKQPKIPVWAIKLVLAKDEI